MSAADDSILEAGLAAPEPLSKRRWPGMLIEQATTWIADNTLVASIGVLLFAFVLVFFWGKVIVTIPAGHEGVIWRRLSGTDLETIFPEGTQIVFPWNVITVYDLRLQRRDVNVVVLSTDGLEINVKLSVRFHPEAKTLPLLHKTVGPDYAERIVVPEVITAVREVMGQYNPQQLYTIQTSEMEGRIIELAAKQARERFVGVDDVLIAQIVLPEVLQAAIQQKLKEQQSLEQYTYRVAEEEKEKDRKRIEAEGIRQFQSIVNEGNPSAATLLWRGIEATLELAKSPNAKVIIIGGRDGMPLILDTSTLAANGIPVPAARGTGAAPPPAGPGRTGGPAPVAPGIGRGGRF